MALTRSWCRVGATRCFIFRAKHHISDAVFYAFARTRSRREPTAPGLLTMSLQVCQTFVGTVQTANKTCVAARHRGAPLNPLSPGGHPHSQIRGLLAPKKDQIRGLLAPKVSLEYSQDSLLPDTQGVLARQADPRESTGLQFHSGASLQVTALIALQVEAFI